MPDRGDDPPRWHPVAPQPWLYTPRFIEAVRAALA